MAKPFFEVFPELKITDQLRGLLNLVQVDKVTSTRDRSQIRVYLNSPRLIHKKNIYDLEKGIKDQLFPDKQLEIKVLEKYNLSEQYTPRKLLEIYKDSLLLELKYYSIVEYNIFRKAEIEFEGQDRMTLTVEDTMVNRDRIGELKRVLEKVFAERCGLPMEVSYRYVPAQGSKLRKQLEERMEEEARAIYWKNHRDELEAMGEGGQAGAPAAVALAQSPTGGGQDFVGGGNDAAPWDMLLQQAASGDVGGEGLETMGANLPGVPGASPAAAGSGAAPGNTKAGNGNGGISQGKGREGQLNKGGRQQKGSWGKDRGGFGDRGFTVKKSNNPEVLYGRDFEDDFLEIEKIDGEMGEVTLRGKILTCESRELRSGKFILTFDISDFTDTISVKMFVRPELFEEVKGVINVGSFIRIKGVTTIDKFDGELTLGSIVGIKKCDDFTSKRMDGSLEKRVELHCHTKMSDMDGVSEVKDIIKRAKKWGMSAIAVTDHGCVQSFPDANHALDKGDTFKVIYGCLLYTSRCV